MIRIEDLYGTTTFPDYDSYDGGYTLDEAYWDAQGSLWITLFGDLISWALFACLLIQVYFYFINFPNDRKVIRTTVLLLFLVELGATGFLTWSGYVSIVVQWGHISSFPPATWGSMLFDCTISSIVHALYSWRIYKLFSRRYLAIALATLVMLLSMAQFSCCFAAAMFNALQESQGPGKQYVARKLFQSWLVLATSADVLITLSMAIKLYSARTGIRSTDRAITKLLYVTIPGGAITAVVTLMILFIQVKFEGTNYYQLLIICLTKFYSNSVLLCLNLRASNVTGIGRHTMLTGFQTTEQNIGSSRVPFDVKVERKVEIGTSSGVMSSTFQSDPAEANNSSDFLGVEDLRKNNVGPYGARREEAY
ncbi:hypothetical protein CBS101457_006263 [Exobasidium rhododendri]|nr:hypothetical protein CBS101457_006263 [Exobasidium rhododendri]